MVWGITELKALKRNWIRLRITKITYFFKDGVIYQHGARNSATLTECLLACEQKKKFKDELKRLNDILNKARSQFQ